LHKVTSIYLYHLPYTRHALKATQLAGMANPGATRKKIEVPKALQKGPAQNLLWILEMTTPLIKSLHIPIFAIAISCITKKLTLCGGGQLIPEKSRSVLSPPPSPALFFFLIRRPEAA
jgi:hypothetical protein